MNLQAFESRSAASAAAASLIASQLEKSLKENAETGLMVSGGSSPLECLELLSCMPLAWHRVSVSLTDERRVPVTDSRSNEKMVREKLLRREAREARFVPLAPANIECLSERLSVSLIGMGEDGHFASLFSDNPDLAGLLDLGEPPGCFPVMTSASDVPRVTANLPLLLSGDVAVLLVFGEKKRAVVERPGDLPVAALLKQQTVPTRVIWAP